MSRLGTCHAQDFNRRYLRTGHLFQNRYKAILVEEDGYLIALVRYIHLNPLRAGLVRSLEELETWPWTGYPQLLGGRGLLPLDVPRVLQAFHDNLDRGREEVREFMRQGVSEGPAGPPGRIEDLSRAPILGSSEFTSAVLSRIEDDGLGWLRRRAQGWTLARVLARVAEHEGIAVYDVISGRRTRVASRVRAVVAHICVRELNLTQAEVARALGVTEAAVSLSLDAGRRAAEAAPWNGDVLKQLSSRDGSLGGESAPAAT
jgi:hypothetical protein